MKISIRFLLLTLIIAPFSINILCASSTETIERCPDCTKSPQLDDHNDAIFEVNALAQTIHALAHQHQNHNSKPCSSNPAQCPQSQCSAQCHGHHHDDTLQETVLSNFANMVQSFFSIVQNPRNSRVLVCSISKMLAGIINVAKEVMKKMHKSMSLEEKELYLEELETTLKDSIRSLARVRNQLEAEEPC